MRFIRNNINTIMVLFMNITWFTLHFVSGWRLDFVSVIVPSVWSIVFAYYLDKSNAYAESNENKIVETEEEQEWL